MAEIDVRYLVEDLRIFLYDVVYPYTYSDEILSSALLSSIKLLGRKWNNRYIPTTLFSVQRSTSVAYSQEEPPVIEPADEAIILLQATIILKSAHAYNSVWDVASWKDDEVSYSNIQSAKSRDYSIQRDLEELNGLLRTRKLHPSKYVPLPGFHKNLNETSI